MPKYIVTNGPVEHDAKRLDDEDEIDMTKAAAAVMLAQGVIRPAGTPKPGSEPPPAEDPPPPPPAN
ncbi:MAG: hypothetical protein K2X32_06350 [Phycisphaerales bacterium]|nr:hypothetical protein [Phycisphaerales bacterium]